MSWASSRCSSRATSRSDVLWALRVALSLDPILSAMAASSGVQYLLTPGLRGRRLAPPPIHFHEDRVRRSVASRAAGSLSAPRRALYWGVLLLALALFGCGEALAQTLALPRVFAGMRLPGRIEYLAALDAAVQQAASGELPAKDALAKAAALWQEITDKLGRDQQRQANARSLGQESL